MWHYISENDYPDDERDIIIWRTFTAHGGTHDGEQYKFYDIGCYYNKKWICTSGKLEWQDEVIAWTELPNEPQ